MYKHVHVPRYLGPHQATKDTVEHPDLRNRAAVSPKAPPVIVAELPKQRTADVVQDLQERFVEDLEMTR